MPETTGTGPGAQVHVAFAPHWVNAWFVRALARPFLCVDGTEHLASWTRHIAVHLPAGPHVLETFIRYRGTSVNLGTGRVRVDLRAGEDVRVRARNGWANHTPFTPTLQPEEQTRNSRPG